MLKQIKKIISSDYTDEFLVLGWGSTLNDADVFIKATVPCINNICIHAPKGFGKTTLLNACGVKFTAIDGDVLRVLGSMSKMKFKRSVSEFTKLYPDIWTDKFSDSWLDYSFLNSLLIRTQFYSKSEFVSLKTSIDVTLCISYSSYCQNMKKRNKWRMANKKSIQDVDSALEFFRASRTKSDIDVIVMEQGLQGVLDSVDYLSNLLKH